MALDVQWTAYGRDAATTLRDAVARAKSGEPLAPVTVVVPSNHVGVASRRLLASGQLGEVAPGGVGLAAVTFLTSYRLAELLGAPALAATGRRPVSTPVLAAAVRSELTDDPGLFRPVAAHAATESALVATYRELRDVSSGALDALATRSPRAAEVVRLHRAVRQRLEPQWYDEEDLLVVAGEAASAPVAQSLGHLVVHLPQRLSRHSGQLLATLSERMPVTVVAGITGLTEADAEVLESLRRMGAPTGASASGGPAHLHVAPERTTIVTASDGDDEVRAAVRIVVDAVRAGTRLDRIALLHASPEPYARLAHEQLHAAGIATNGAAVLPLAARMVGRTLLDLLALPEHGFRRQDVFAWLASAPILVDGRWTPTTAWERVSREAAVVGGRHDWDVLLERFAQGEDERASQAESDDESADWVPERARTRAEHARGLRRFVLHLIDDLGAAATRPRPWGEHAIWAQRLVVSLLGPPARRDGWPEDERKAAERVELAIERLGALDAVEGPVALDVFARTLALELEADLGRVGRFGEGVLVGSVEMGIGLDLDLLVVLGLAEGSFPSTVRDDSLLPDRERAAAAGELVPRGARVERQHRQLIASLAGADRQVLCVPRGDLRRSVDRVPSRWVLDIATTLAGATDSPWWTKDLHRAEQPWVQHVASFDAGLRHMAVPATAQEHRLRALLAAEGELTSVADPVIVAGAEVVAARRSSRFTRFDGNLAGLPIPSPVDHIVSPTRLERWAVCPHAHFVQDILRAAPVENPEDDLMISARDKGSLIHEVLERFFGEVIERGSPIAPGTPWTDADRERLADIGEEVCRRYEEHGLTGRPIFWNRDRRRILADLQMALDLDVAHRAAFGSRPVAVELGFGWGDGVDAVSIPLGDGRELRFRGRADRLDVSADGTIHVVDYKSGTAPSARSSPREEDPVLGGTKLQLPVYGLAGRLQQGRPDAPVRSEYWFVTRRGEFKRVGYDVTDEVVEATVATLSVMVQGIEGGVFPSRPSDEASTTPFNRCWFCDPDFLGVSELRQQWHRKRHDPLVQPYAELVEPTLEPEPEGAAGAGSEVVPS